MYPAESTVWHVRISCQSAHPVLARFSCGSTDTHLLSSLGIMKEVCCNSYCVSDISFTFANKRRQFILAEVKWQWHWVRWKMIKHSTHFFLTTLLLEIYVDWSSPCFLRGGERHFWMLWCYTKRNDMFMLLLAKHRRMVLNMNVCFFSSAAG